MKAYITGVGIISSMGAGVEKTYASLVEGRSGIAPITLLDSTKYNNHYVGGELKMTNDELRKELKAEGDTCTRTGLLGLYALREAMRNADCRPAEDGIKTAFISATTVAGMVKTEKHYMDFLNRTNNVNFIDTHDNGYQTIFLNRKEGPFDYLTSINTACSSSTNSIILGMRMIKNGWYDRVVVGGTDALCRYTMNGFNSLFLIDSEPTKPFDQNRKGINLGEGAAYLVLESEKLIQQKGIRPSIAATGYGVANDAFHQTSVSDDGKGVQIAMKKALQTAEVSESGIDYINAHGTGTANNDVTEGIAIKTVFQDVPAFSSTKPFTGHTLGAAGAIEAAILYLTLKRGFIPPNLNFEQAIEDHGLVPSTIVNNKQEITHGLSNSIGIGGFCSSLVFSKVN